MASDAPPTPIEARGIPSPKQHFLETFEQEHATTLRVLRAYPADRLELKPAARSNTALDLVRTFVLEMGLLEKALTTGFDWSAPPAARPPLPGTLEEIVQAFDQAHGRVAEVVRGMSEAQLAETVRFPVAPKTFGEWSKIRFLWMVLHDQIHHRGQLSVYLRMAGGRLPSIYGPTADEPFF